MSGGLVDQGKKIFKWEKLHKQNSKYAPMVFTEQGVAMLSSVLNSPTAIEVNIQIIRVFTKMRELLLTHKDILVKLEQMEKKLLKQDARRRGPAGVLPRRGRVTWVFQR